MGPNEMIRMSINSRMDKSIEGYVTAKKINRPQLEGRHINMDESYNVELKKIRYITLGVHSRRAYLAGVGEGSVLAVLGLFT